MKTPEDEAFDDIERRQGGFQAKRKMAADKQAETETARGRLSRLLMNMKRNEKPLTASRGKYDKR